MSYDENRVSDQIDVGMLSGILMKNTPTGTKKYIKRRANTVRL